MLKAICAERAALAPALYEAKVVNRENTGHGFYTHIQTESSVPPAEDLEGVVDGPNLRVRVGITEVPMGFILWMKAGKPDCLEGFQYATEGEIDLKVHDLSAMSALGEWS